MGIKCGIVGLPNVGKSTLVNALVGAKVSIVAPKPQTTRHRILGIRTTENAQLVLVDTPGLHAPTGAAINRYLNRTARNALDEAHAVALVVDVTRWTKEDDAALEAAGASEAVRATVAASYDALEAAAGFFELQAKHLQGFSFADAGSAFQAYRTELFRFDQLYRWFMRASETVEPMGWSLLHELRDRMEDAYSGWFVGQLASAWGAVVEGPAGLLAKWKLDEVVNQQHFYARHVAPAFDGGAKRVFVVISDAFRFDSVGKVLPSVTLRLAEDGEILAKGESVFRGYHKDEAATREAFDEEGWFKTGDVGRFTEDGFLQIVDRKKDILVTAGGKNVPPANIELRFQGDPRFLHVVVYGDGKKYLVCGVWLNDAVVDAELSHVAPADRRAAREALVQAKVDEVNRDLASYESLKAFVIVDTPLTVESELLTASLKVRRKKVVEAFSMWPRAGYCCSFSSAESSSQAMFFSFNSS